MTEEVKDQEDTGKKEDDVQDEVVVQLTPLESQAKSFGWLPKEEWVEAGHDESEWAPAKHFMKFGELKKQVIERDKALSKQERLIKVMKNHHLNVKQTAYEQALKTLRAEREAALDANDLVTAERLRDRIDEEKDKFAKDSLPADIEQEITQAAQVQAQNPPPAEYYEFLDRNPWYIADVSQQDEISQEADKLGAAEVAFQRARNQPVDPAQIYKTVERKIRKLFTEKFETPKSPQASSSSQSGNGNVKKTSLTEAELEVAKTFGITPEKYAEELKGYKGR